MVRAVGPRFCFNDDSWAAGPGWSGNAPLALKRKRKSEKRTAISKEWLDQVIQTLQPRIEGVVIQAVTISEEDNTACYVVELPESHTADMAH